MGAANISKGSKYSTGVGTNSPYQSCYPPQHFDLVWPVFLLRGMLSQGCMNEVLCNYIPSFPTRYRSTVQSLKWVCFMTSYWVRLIRHTFTVLQGTCVPTTIRAGRKIKVWFSSILFFAIVFLSPARQLSILGAVMTWPMRPRPSSQGPLEWFVTPASKQAISLNLRQSTNNSW